MTTAQALRTFFAHASPRILLATWSVLLLARLLVGGFTAWDALIPVILLAAHPFTEWLIHVHLLHLRPRRVFGRLLDPVASREHRKHHRDPTDLPLVFIPLPTLLASFPLLVAAAWLLTPTVELALTALLSTSSIALAYEWVHYVCHIPCTPRTAFMRSRIRHHRLHHYKNEQYWYGVSLHLSDRVLGTQPAAEEVPRSPTARDLEARPEAG